MIPKPRRRRSKVTGKFTGSFYGRRRDGQEVSLQTRDAGVALERQRLLRAGKWEPGPRSRVSTDEDGYAPEVVAEVVAAAAVESSLSPDAAPIEDPPHSNGVAHGELAGAAAAVAAAETAAAAADAGGAAPPPPPPPPVVPDVLGPGPGSSWNQAATEAAGAEAEGESSTSPPSQFVDPDVILQLAAEGWVAGCKMLGKWIAAYRGTVPNDVPEGTILAGLESMTVACTKQVITSLLPSAAELGPEWGMIGGGLAICAMQFLGAAPAPRPGGDAT